MKRAFKFVAGSLREPNSSRGARGLHWRALTLITYVALFGAINRQNTIAADSADVKAADTFFVTRVAPLLESRCVSCHGADKSEGGLRLDSREAAIKGGDSGPALVPGKPDDSLLLQAVKRTHRVLEMPPKSKLGARDIDTFERWIRDGAPWPDAPPSAKRAAGQPDVPIGDAGHDPRNPIAQLFGGERLDLWSLQPVARPAVPTTKNADWAKCDLDQFVLANLEKDGIAPLAEVKPRLLLRRLFFDLTGLPPTPEQASDFARDVSARGFDAAYTAQVEALLASPRFGEHFTRMWLDVVRYSDSNGFDWDEFRPQAWRFRDYVVRSFNSDKPFDQFIREQLAGDELFDGPPRTAAEQDELIATGYLRLGPHDNAAKLFNEQDRSRAELLADVTETTAGAFLGMTLTCCRCHDHKYDPISQADHYRFRAFFAAMKFADDVPIDLAGEQEAAKKANEAVEARAKPLRDKLASLPETDKAMRDQVQEQIGAIERERRPLTHALLMTDSSESVVATHVLYQGDHTQPRGEVQAGFFSVLDAQPAEFAHSTNSHSTGRRLTLANWIASPKNPLTSRVFVNRVWQILMGQALVATPNDFGLAGARPEDAALLDWLAIDLVSNGWSVKKLVREITLSAAYRQAPACATDHFALRAPRRLSAEQLRDSLLAVSGLLTAKSGGPPVWPDLPKDVLDSNPAFLDDNPEKTKGWYPSPKSEQYCRSLFLVQKRNTREPMLESFDLPDNSTPCARRAVSTVAPQALTLLNSPLATEAARAFAERVQHDAGADPTKQVRRAFELALQRPPDDSEAARCRELLEKRDLASLCRAFFNLNEFVYVD